MIIASTSLMSIVTILALSIIFGLRKEACAEHILVTIGALTVTYLAAMVVLLMKLFV